MAKSGMYYINNGFRVCIAVNGYKWTNLIFIHGTGIRCKRVKNHRVGQAHPIIGNRTYTTPQLARKLLNTPSINGTKRIMSNRTRKLLNLSIEESQL